MRKRRSRRREELLNGVADSVMDHVSSIDYRRAIVPSSPALGVL